MPPRCGDSLTAGFAAALTGIRTVASNPSVRRTYAGLVAAIIVMATGLEVAGIWGVWEWTRAGAESGALVTVGLLVLRIAGIAMVLLAAPLLAVLLANVAFPVLGERVFLAGLRELAPGRATELTSHPGLSARASVGITLRRVGLFIALTTAVLGLGLVPFVGALVAPWLQGLLTARLLGWELLDPYFDRLGYGYHEQRRFLRDRRSSIIGFALPFSFVMAIPIVGPLFFGLAQGSVGALVVRVFEADGPSPSSHKKT